MRLSLAIIYIYVFIVLVSSCNKRYWFRSKIDLPDSKKYSVKINVVNLSNSFLSKDFEEIMRKSAAKELKKKGYFELPIDSPQFLFTLVLKVDSFNASLKNGTNKMDLYTTDSMKPNLNSHGNSVKAIIVVCELKNYKRGWIKWLNYDDVYYFGEYRDIGRTEGMVRYLIRIAKDKEIQTLNSVTH